MLRCQLTFTLFLSSCRCVTKVNLKTWALWRFVTGRLILCLKQHLRAFKVSAGAQRRGGSCGKPRNRFSFAHDRTDICRSSCRILSDAEPNVTWRGFSSSVPHLKRKRRKSSVPWTLGSRHGFWNAKLWHVGKVVIMTLKGPMCATYKKQGIENTYVLL